MDVSLSNHRTEQASISREGLYWWFSASHPISGSQWTDLSGNGRHATLSSGVQRAQDSDSRYFLFGDTSTSITNLIVPPNSGNYTFFHRARYNGVNEGRIFTGLTDSSNCNWFSGFHVGNAGVAYHGTLITPHIDVHGTSWVISSDQCNLYRSNGVQRSDVGEVTGPLCSLTVNGLTSQVSDWAISDMLMYDRELSLSEILRVEKYLNLTQPGTSLKGSANILGTSGSSPSNSFMMFPVTTLTDFTITFWIKTTDTYGTSDSTQQWYHGKGLVDGKVMFEATDFGISLLAGKIAFGVGWPDTTIFSTRTINDGTWHHVAAVRNGSAMTIYLDGVVDISISDGPTGVRTAVNQLAIGVLGTLDMGSLSGYMEEVRLYDQASAAYVADAVQGLLASPPPFSLLNYYPLNENGLDYSGNLKHGTVTNVFWSEDGT
jgi:hypothetical protein